MKTNKSVLTRFFRRNMKMVSMLLILSVIVFFTMTDSYANNGKKFMGDNSNKVETNLPSSEIGNHEKDSSGDGEEGHRGKGKESISMEESADGMDTQSVEDAKQTDVGSLDSSNPRSSSGEKGAGAGKGRDSIIEHYSDHEDEETSDPGIESDYEAMDEPSDTITDGKSIELVISVIFEDKKGEEITGEEVEMTVVKLEDDVAIYKKTSVTNDGEVIIPVPFGNSCILSGEEVPGYVNSGKIEVSLSKNQGSFTKDISYKYVKGEIVAKSINLSSEKLVMVRGFDHVLTASIDPLNANKQDIRWSLDENLDQAISIIEDGHILALTKGVAIIKANLIGTNLYDECKIDVVEIKNVIIQPKVEKQGKLIDLGNTVKAELSDGSIRDMNIIWEGAVIIDDTQYITFQEAGTFKVMGEIKGYDGVVRKTVYMDIVVEENSDYTGLINKAKIDPDTTYIYQGENGYIGIVEVVSEIHDLDTLIWSSSDIDILKVEKHIEAIDENNENVLYNVEKSSVAAKITGNKLGTVTVSVMNSSGKVLDTCIVSVTMDPSIVDPSYIYAGEENWGLAEEHFDNRENVYIYCMNLIEDTYYVKVEKKGSDKLLNIPDSEGSTEYKVELEGDKFYFNLYDRVPFELSENNSKEYFVSMSKEADFPTGDEEIVVGDETISVPRTYSTNFKIGSPVPTGQIIVNVFELVDGVKKPVGKKSRIYGTEVILGRELETTAEGTNFENYLNPFKNLEESLRALGIVKSGEGFTLEDVNLEKTEGSYVEKILDSDYMDEVKMTGRIGIGKNDANEDVDLGSYVGWNVPRESLKIGGYILLIDTRGENKFSTNLDLPNPYSDDGDLLKEIHITRDGTVIVEITVKYLD